MKYTCRLRILENNILLLTNSLIFKEFLQESFASFPFRFQRSNLIKLSYILKNPEDHHGALLLSLKITGEILKKIEKKYWVFHTSAFSYKNYATIILGDPGKGKSSLCFAAGLCSAKIITDEPVFLDKQTLRVIPFKYLLKIENFYQNFSKWNLPSNVHQKRFIEKGRFDFNIFTKNSLKTLGIKVENNALPATIFLKAD